MNSRGFLPILIMIGFAFVFVLVLLVIALYYYYSHPDSTTKNKALVQKNNTTQSKSASTAENEGDIRPSTPPTGNISSISLLDLAGNKPLEVTTPNGNWSEFRDEELNFSFYYPVSFIKGNYGIIQSTNEFNSPNFIGIMSEPIEIYRGKLEDLVVEGILPGKIEKNLITGETVSYWLIEDKNTPGKQYYYHDFFLQNSQYQIFKIRIEAHSAQSNTLVDQIVKTITIINKDKMLGDEDLEIKGTVTYKSGDCMPRICGDPNNCGSTSCKSEKVSRSVYFFNPVTKKDMDGTTYIGKTLPIKTIKSDSRGNFSTKLPPGSYSIMTEDQGKIYCDLLTDFFNCLYTFTKANNPTVDLLINKAAY